MKASMLTAGILAAVACAMPASAQEHWTEGPVWQVNYFRTKPGKFDDYMKYLRANYAVTIAESKKQGLILDSKMFINPTPRDEKDWNIGLAVLFPSYARALDYNADNAAKGRAITEKHFRTSDEAKQREMNAPRFGWRDFISTQYVREVALKPMP